MGSSFKPATVLLNLAITFELYQALLFRKIAITKVTFTLRGSTFTIQS